MDRIGGKWITRHRGASVPSSHFCAFRILSSQLTWQFPGFLSAIFLGFIDKALSETQEFAGDLAERGPFFSASSPNFQLRCPDLKLSQVLLVIVNILKLVKNHVCGGGLGNGGFFFGRPRSKLDVMLRPMNQRISQQICALTQWPSMTLFPFLVPLQHACVKFWWC